MPPTSYPHLQFRRIETNFPRRKQQGRPRPVDRDAPAHSRTLIASVGLLENTLADNEDDVFPHFDPSLIFRARLAPSTRVEDVQWRNAGLRVLSTYPGNVTILFANDTQLREFKMRIEAYGAPIPQGQKNPQFNWIGNIESLESWSREDRTGQKLRQIQIEVDREYIVDVEIWYLDDKENCRQRLHDLRQFIRQAGQEYLDDHLGESLCLARVKVLGDILNRLLDWKIVATVELPPKPDIPIATILQLNIDQFAPTLSPPEDAPRICIIDSGLNTGHPILGPAIGYTDAIPASIVSPLDENGHGTRVGGLALYGDLTPGIESKNFVPQLYLCSVRVTNAQNEFDDETLIVNQMQDAIDLMHEGYGCRVFNISLGDPQTVLNDSNRQTFWASILDELVREKDIVVVVSTGNYRIITDEPEALVNNFIHHLSNEAARIIDPAMAALVITVGSLAPSEASFLGSERNPKDPAYRVVARFDEPSPFTRRGPGYEGAVKPELCEYGGNVLWDGRLQRFPENDLGLGIISTHHQSTQGRLFTAGNGTSYAAPQVAHIAARILKQYPEVSGNLVRALLVASAEVPQATKNLVGFDTSSQKRNVLNLCGYGRPDIIRALYTTPHRVVLFAEDAINLDHFHIYAMPLPKEFKECQGSHKITVTLAFDPPVKHSRRDYMGCRMSFKLFRDEPLYSIVEKCQARHLVNDVVAEDIVDSLREFPLWPSYQFRHPSTVQRGTYEISRRLRVVDDLCYLAVWCENRWIADIDALQRYAVVVTLECEETVNINLHNIVQSQIAQPIQARIRL